MIKVLQNWSEIGRAVEQLENMGLPRHSNTEKCWDMVLLSKIAEPLSRQAKILDMGCSGLYTLRLLDKMGFSELLGLDLTPTCIDRIKQLKIMFERKQLKPVYRIAKKDMLASGLAGESFDLITSISVIEHGVDLDKFIMESARLLKPGGRLFVTADYWPDRIDCSDSVKQFGLNWQILCKDDIEKILAKAKECGLRLMEPGEIPLTDDKCIFWQKKAYTFIALGFTK